MAIIRGTNGDDTLRGTPQGDQIYGLGGVDLIEGEAGNDRIYGGAGADQLSESSSNIGADGNDLFDGGAGSDTLFFGFNFVGVRLALAEAGGTALARQGSETDRVVNVESVVGTGFDDRLIGNSADNTLEAGFAGTDHLDGRGGDDSLFADSSSGPATLIGGAGADVLVGSQGDDTLLAGTGADSFVDGGVTPLYERSGTDVIDLGRDGQQDRYHALIDVERADGIGVDRVRNFDGEDRLWYEVGASRGGPFVDVKDFLDSDDNQVIDARDLDVRPQLGNPGNLVLDIDAVFERALGFEASAFDQHTVLVGVRSLSTSQVLSAGVPEPPEAAGDFIV